MSPKSESLVGGTINVGRGMLMGAADIVPGVSGGTIALILGIYERLITAISRFDRTLVGHLRNGRLAEAARHVDSGFLATLLLGIGLGAVALGSVMHYLLEEHRQHTYGVFFGLILASSWHVARLTPRWESRDFLWLAFGAAAAYLLVGLPLLTSPPQTLWYVFLCGSVAICAMILPGISGAFILVILGSYPILTEAVHQLTRGVVSPETLLMLAALGAGAVVGLLSFSKFLHWLLEHYEADTLAVLCGFMLGSLRKIWPFKTDLTPSETNLKLKEFVNRLPDTSENGTWSTVALAVAAFGLVLLLEWSSRTSGEGAGGSD